MFGQFCCLGMHTLSYFCLSHGSPAAGFSPGPKFSSFAHTIEPFVHRTAIFILSSALKLCFALLAALCPFMHQS